MSFRRRSQTGRGGYSRCEWIQQW